MRPVWSSSSTFIIQCGNRCVNLCRLDYVLVADIDFVAVVVVRYEMLIGFMLPVYECMLLVGWLVTSVYLDGLLADWLADWRYGLSTDCHQIASFFSWPAWSICQSRRNRKRKIAALKLFMCLIPLNYIKWSILQINRLNCNISVTPDLCSVDHLLIFILYSIDWVQILAQGEERSFSKFTIYLLIQPDV